MFELRDRTRDLWLTTSLHDIRQWWQSVNMYKQQYVYELYLSTLK